MSDDLFSHMGKFETVLIMIFRAQANKRSIEQLKRIENGVRFDLVKDENSKVYIDYIQQKLERIKNPENEKITRFKKRM